MSKSATPVQPVNECIVSRWFGEQFRDLHPGLQTLHRGGGRLSGTVEIRIGTGIGGWIGKRLAKSLGVPVDLPSRGFRVDISHTEDALVWLRRFDNGAVLKSSFLPVGAWPKGYWIEETGALRLELAVDIVDQGWQWRPLRASFKGFPLPLWLLPQSKAGKRILGNGNYLFAVEFSLPVVGLLLGYGGELEVEANTAMYIAQRF